MARPRKNRRNTQNVTQKDTNMTEENKDLAALPAEEETGAEKNAVEGEVVPATDDTAEAGDTTTANDDEEDATVASDADESADEEQPVAEPQAEATVVEPVAAVEPQAAVGDAVKELSPLDVVQTKTGVHWKNISKYVEYMNPNKPSNQAGRVQNQLNLSRAFQGLIVAEEDDKTAIANIRTLLNLIRTANKAGEVFGFAESRRAIEFVPNNKLNPTRRAAFQTLYTVLLRLADEGADVKFDWTAIAESIPDDRGELTANRLRRAVGIKIA